MRRPLILAAIVLTDLGLSGWWLSAAEHVSYVTGLYWALATAATVGYLTPDRHGLAAIAIVILTLVPLFGAIGGMLLSGHIRRHHVAALDAMEKRIKAHAEERHVALMEHVTKRTVPRTLVNPKERM